MKKEALKKVRITDTTLRDAHQSLWATRMRTDDILKIAETIDDAGYYSLECWGGATFDVCMRFLRENPWERLRQIKNVCRKTPLQMLLREILIANSISLDAMVDTETMKAMYGMSDLLRYSLIIVSCVPVLVMYPFVKKFFLKGVMLGSVKG